MVALLLLLLLLPVVVSFAVVESADEDEEEEEDEPLAILLLLPPSRFLERSQILEDKVNAHTILAALHNSGGVSCKVWSMVQIASLTTITLE